MKYARATYFFIRMTHNSFFTIAAALQWRAPYLTWVVLLLFLAFAAVRYVFERRRIRETVEGGGRGPLSVDDTSWTLSGVLRGGGRSINYWKLGEEGRGRSGTNLEAKAGQNTNFPPPLRIRRAHNAALNYRRKIMRRRRAIQSEYVPNRTCTAPLFLTNYWNHASSLIVNSSWQESDH